MPVFHEWFIETFPEPTAWLSSRLAYGRTAAVMSMVGSILGYVVSLAYLSRKVLRFEGWAIDTVKTYSWTRTQAT